MSLYHLFDNIMAVQPAPPFLVQPWGKENPNVPPDKQSFMVSLVGGSSATVQLVASNDGTNWVNYNAPIILSAAGQASSGGNQNFAYFGAMVTAIGGAGASVSCTMQA